MPAYFVIHNKVLDDDAMQTYIPAAGGSIYAAGGEVLVVSEQCDVIEGTAPYPRTVVVKFDTREQAMAWYESPEYAELRPIRLGCTEGFAVLVDGFEMPA